MFGEIKNSDVTLPNLADPHPYDEQHRGKVIKFVPARDQDKITIAWVLPNVGRDIESNPLHYHAHLLGHEGPNSLLSYLTSEGLAHEISSSSDEELWGYSQLSLDITLTKKGL